MVRVAQGGEGTAVGGVQFDPTTHLLASASGAVILIVRHEHATRLGGRPQRRCLLDTPAAGLRFVVELSQLRVTPVGFADGHQPLLELPLPALGARCLGRKLRRRRRRWSDRRQLKAARAITSAAGAILVARMSGKSELGSVECAHLRHRHHHLLEELAGRPIPLPLQPRLRAPLLLLLDRTPALAKGAHPREWRRVANPRKRRLKRKSRVRALGLRVELGEDVVHASRA